ncbi:MAG: BCD family MFS transporter [Hyphomicrobium sp.]|jgi:BCD family chlorophyll transporter-like MFS transporter|nr:BCD family MFS transporter [Hyphomicrobium sp.]
MTTTSAYSDTQTGYLGWLGIIRMGLVQTSLGAIIVLTTSTINRVMVVELALAAALPGALVAWHYALQFLRPRWGYGADTGGRRTPWIIFGIATLGLGGTGAALAVALLATSFWPGLALAVLAFTLVGIGVGAAGTNLLALLATRVDPGRRAPAATIVWMMMIAGFVVTTIIASHYLAPFSMTRLVAVTATVSAIALAVSCLALWGVEPARPLPDRQPVEANSDGASKVAFREALAEVWNEPQARRFTIFVFVSMLAYSMQDLILEPFAGFAFGLSPAESTKLAGHQHTGVFLGMALVAIAGHPRVGFGSLRSWTVGGCIASALALLALVLAGLFAPDWPLTATVIALGFANGAFAVAAIGTMMGLAGEGRERREGIRMGLWGAAQAIAFGAGGFIGAAAADLFRGFVSEPADAFTVVFAFEAMLFLVSAILGLRAIVETRTAAPPLFARPVGDVAKAGTAA